VEHVATIGMLRNAYKSLIGKAERKIPFWKLRHEWEDNIKMNLNKVEEYALDSSASG
jgi:hypothetical protein